MQRKLPQEDKGERPRVMMASVSASGIYCQYQNHYKEWTIEEEKIMVAPMDKGLPN